MPTTHLTPDEVHAGVTTRPPYHTLGDELALQVRRQLDLLELYVRLPYEPHASDHQRRNANVCTGPAIAFLKREIVEAFIAAASGDVPAMIKSCRTMKENR